MKKLKLDVAMISGKNTPEEKMERIKEFRNGKYRIIITTNMMARGIDIRTVCLVINMYPPRREGYDKNSKLDTIVYQHRIGRTGRYKDFGVAFTIYSGYPG